MFIRSNQIIDVSAVKTVFKHIPTILYINDDQRSDMCLPLNINYNSVCGQI
jgi:hypothetical protein